MYEKIALSLPIDHFPKHNVKGFSIPINIKKNASYEGICV